MEMPKNLHEASSKLSKNGQYWDATLITPGKGSSGIYSEEMLKEYGPTAFPKGSHSYVDHPASEDEQRSPKNLMGVLAEDARYVEGRGLVGKIQVMPHWADFVEAVAPHTGLSIYATGDGRDTEEGFVVESLDYSIQNTCDLVSYAGRGGSLVERLKESAINKTSVETGTGAATADADSKEREQNMDELKALVEALASKIDGLDTKLVEMDAKVESVVKLSESATAADAAKVDALEVADKLAEAKLTESGRKRVLESVKSGAAVEDAIKTETSLRDEILAEARTVVTPGRVVESVSDDFKISGAATVRIGA